MYPQGVQPGPAAASTENLNPGVPVIPASCSFTRASRESDAAKVTQLISDESWTEPCLLTAPHHPSWHAAFGYVNVGQRECSLRSM